MTGVPHRPAETHREGSHPGVRDGGGRQSQCLSREVVNIIDKPQEWRGPRCIRRGFLSTENHNTLKKDNYRKSLPYVSTHTSKIAQTTCLH